MLVFARTFVAFLSHGDPFSNAHGLLVFASLSFSYYNFFLLAIFPNRYNVYQNSHYLSRSN